jgi:multiple sugar transport system ATP-binding protein
VFQSYALYPHMTVAQNMEYGLKLRGMPKGERAAKVNEAARLLEIENELDRKPRANIASLQARLGTTTLYVTHDQVEAMTMGHRVAVLRDARLQQVDTPRSLYERPANVFVAGFIGSPAMNLRDATLGSNGVRVDETALALSQQMTSSAQAAGAEQLTIGVRPESATLAAADEPGALALIVALVEELGADAYVYDKLAGDAAATKPWVMRCDGRDAPHIGDRVGVTVPTAEAHLFDRTTGLRLG